MYKSFIVDNKVYLIKIGQPRLGYACICETIKKNVKVGSTCIQKTFVDKGINYVIELAFSNLTSILKVLEWNEAHNIKFYRMNSKILPHFTNPKFIPDGQKYAYDIFQFKDICMKIGDYARKHNHRLTFHPDQYNQIGTPHKTVFEKTSKELEMHADLLDLMELDLNSVMIVHGGGFYEDKPKTIERWIQQFFLLPETVRRRIVIENCERIYSVFDMLYISRRICRPVVFDTHHHECYSKVVEPQPHPSEFLGEVLATWFRLGLRPKFHVSNQAPDKKIGAHSEYVEFIPSYLVNLDVDVMIEAKKKELAVLMLQ